MKTGKPLLRLTERVSRVTCDSEAIIELEYFHSRDVLRVTFTSFRVYEFYRVTEREFRDLRDARSIGSHFNQSLKLTHGFNRLGVSHAQADA